MLYQAMKYCRNFFPVGYFDNTFTIKNGTLALPFMQKDQYFLIEGSVFNDGVHKYPVTNLHDETFRGTITPMAIPEAFLQLVNEIKVSDSVNNTNNPYLSESFDGYSYTRASTPSGAPAGWQTIFADRLKIWRKL